MEYRKESSGEDLIKACENLGTLTDQRSGSIAQAHIALHGSDYTMRQLGSTGKSLLVKF